MRQVITVIAFALLPGCWADFPDDLVQPDNGPALDLGQADARADGPRADGPAADLAGDGPTTDAPSVDGPSVDGPVTDGGSQLAALGVACKVDDDCYSGRCVDGVCCNSTCIGKCMRCDVAGKEGQCYPAPDGTDPDGECQSSAPTNCGFDGECDGLGGCRNWAAGTLCGASMCGGSNNEKVILAKVCDGSGVCKTFGEVDCSPYQCDPSTKRCYDACTASGASQCVPGASCSAGKCDGALKPEGASCTLSSQCASGHCQDGVCCDEACNGACETCYLATTGGTSTPPLAGKCIDVPPGLDPDNDCGVEAKHTCQKDGTCDGQGGCRLYLAGTICQTRLCNIQTTPDQLEPLHVCDGAGQCLASGTATSCGDYVCAGGLSCYGRCTSDAQCESGRTCNSTTLTCQ